MDGVALKLFYLGAEALTFTGVVVSCHVKIFVFLGFFDIGSYDCKLDFFPLPNRIQTRRLRRSLRG